jgi:hypothetical protein
MLLIDVQLKRILKRMIEGGREDAINVLLQREIITWKDAAIRAKQKQVEWNKSVIEIDINKFE